MTYIMGYIILGMIACFIFMRITARVKRHQERKAALTRALAQENDPSTTMLVEKFKQYQR